jgi:hypothetical protein
MSFSQPRSNRARPPRIVADPERGWSVCIGTITLASFSNPHSASELLTALRDGEWFELGGMPLRLKPPQSETPSQIQKELL